MTKQTEALNLALDAFGLCDKAYKLYGTDGEKALARMKANEAADAAITAIKEALAQPAVAEQHKQEPFGYFKPAPFGWTDCAETDEGAIALYEKPQPKETEHDPVAWAETAMRLADDLSIESLWLGSHERTDKYENAGRASWQTVEIRKKREDVRERLRQHVYTTPPQRKPWVSLTDADCTRIYNEANGITTKHPPITTERIFKAMRAAHGIKE